MADFPGQWFDFAQLLIRYHHVAGEGDTGGAHVPDVQVVNPFDTGYALRKIPYLVNLKTAWSGVHQNVHGRLQ